MKTRNIAVGLLALILSTCCWAAPPLQQQLEALATQYQSKGDAAIYAKNLKTGQAVEIHADVPAPTASVIKLTILLEAMYEVKAGRQSLDEKLSLRKEDQVGGSGVLQFFSTPHELTLQDALYMMIAVSDNTAANLVIDRLGLDAINGRIASMGLKNTRLYEKVFSSASKDIPPEERKFGLGKSTAREMAEVMQSIANCDLQEAKLCDLMLAMLKHQFFRDDIPRYLESADTPEKGLVIANKTGALDEVRNDVGVVYSKAGPLVISVFTYNNKDHNWTPDNAGEIFAAEAAKTIVRAWSP